MFFGSINCLLYLRKDRIELFLGSKKAQVLFPASLVQNIEILDPASFKQLVHEFLSQLELKNKKILVVLSEELFFQTIIAGSDDEQPEVRASQFISSVPFDPAKIAFKKITSGNQIRLIAANKDFFRPFGSTETSWKILAVVPISIFQDSEDIGNELDVNMVRKIMTKKPLIKAGNLLSPEEEVISKSWLSKNYLTLLILVILSSILLAFIVFSDMDYFAKNENVQKPTNLPKESSTSAEQEESSASAKESDQIRIQIFNGSGIVGQAAKLKNELNSLGYNNIEIGDAVGAGATKTIAVFSSQVSAGDREQILEKLKTIFETVEAQEGPEKDEFDAIITTGNYIPS
ncbi:LytR C-terminal domain-containing protein [Candidatus Daviesbacteria bacterium]|nr:LytR C-terminal domain-containing protein [Candidatus Daviesbacteria bacterium]